MKERIRDFNPKRWLSDELWSVIGPASNKVRNTQGPKGRQDDRAFLTAIAYLLREGCSWRGLPPQFGHWHNVYVRFRRWEKSRTWGKLWLVLQGPEASKARELFIDSTSVKVHPHAAGAPKKNGGWQALGRS